MMSAIALNWVGSVRNNSSIGFTSDEREKKGQVFAWGFFLSALLALILLGVYLGSDSFMYR